MLKIYHASFSLLLLVDGKFSPWTPWKQCSKTCGGGTQTRTRQCDNPPPSQGGKPCVGDTLQTRVCSINVCPGEFY